MNCILVFAFSELSNNYNLLISGKKAPSTSTSDDVDEVRQLQNEKHLRQSTEDEINKLKSEVSRWKQLEVWDPLDMVKKAYQYLKFD